MFNGVSGLQGQGAFVIPCRIQGAPQQQVMTIMQYVIKGNGEEPQRY